jgi:hypothetical protein
VRVRIRKASADEAAEGADHGEGGKGGKGGKTWPQFDPAAPLPAATRKPGRWRAWFAGVVEEGTKP